MAEQEQLNNLATHLDSLLNAYQRSTHDLSAYEVKAYSDDVTVILTGNLIQDILQLSQVKMAVMKLKTSIIQKSSTQSSKLLTIL